MYNIHYNVYYPWSNRCANQWIILNLPRQIFLDEIKKKEEESVCWTHQEKVGGACCVQDSVRRRVASISLRITAPFFLLVSLARALPPASTRPFLPAHPPRSILTWPVHRCTRTTTAQVCALTCQWKSSPLESRDEESSTFSFPTLLFNF